jgi:hypothetical protein
MLGRVRGALGSERVGRQIFGQGHRKRLGEMWGIVNTVSMPLVDEISKSGDSGLPYVVAHPDSQAAAIYRTLAGRGPTWDPSRCHRLHQNGTGDDDIRK